MSRRNLSVKIKKAYVSHMLMKKIPVESHGLASHAMGCPRRMRNWKGISYANVTDDCIGCYCFVNVEYGKEEIKYVICNRDGNPRDEDPFDK